MLIAQISDFHVRAGRRPLKGRVHTAAALDACVAHLNRLEPAPDVVLATGDLVDTGHDADYEVLTEILAPLVAPVFVIPGNHDDRRGLRRAFGGHPWIAGCDDWIQYSIEDWPVRLVALDSVVPGRVWGQLCSERLAWLDAALSREPDRPTIVFLHHPPFATGITHMDAVGLREGREPFARLVSRHPQVERLLCGHVHRAIQTRWSGTLASTAPSTAHQIALDLEPDAAGGYVLEPPACHLHLWTPASGLITHLSPIGDFAGPFPFNSAPSE